MSSLAESQSSYLGLEKGDSFLIQQEETDSNQLSNVPPLVIVSNRVKQYSSLAKLANPGVAVVLFDYEGTSLTRLLQLVGERLKGRKALCVALVVHGEPGLIKLTRQNIISLAVIKEDLDIQGFFQDLVSSFVHTTGEFARLDILNCPVQQNMEGKRLIITLSDIVKVPVSSSDDIWGVEVEGEQIGTLYFDGRKLKEWTMPQKLDKYEKIRIVGKGAYGEAILYRRKEDDSQVILKQINILELNKTERQNVVNEIKILSMLDHPHIISYYDNFEEDGLMMIEMEFADGGSLQQYLNKQQNSLSEIEVLTKFSQMVDALNFIHKNNILHRDLKTANVFLTRHGIVKLGDFGISKVLSATHQAAQTVVGTPYYISPEICEGKYYDTKSDIWSLGCILYEMLCLQRTFEGTNLPALVHKIVEGSFEPIKGKYSDGLKQIVRRMLQKEPSRRPSASDLHDDIIPPLLNAIQVKEGILQPTKLATSLDEKDMKSFLYLLDGRSLLFSPVNCPIQERIINVAVGFGHVIAVTFDTVVYSWGDNGHGQLGHGDTDFHKDPTRIESLKGRNIHSAECGGEFSIFKNENGIIMSCGRGDKGVLGHGNYNDCYQPEIIQDLLAHDSHLISCGESHVVVLTLEWRVFVWGAGEHGQLGTGTNTNCCTPTELVLRSPGARMDERAVLVNCGMDATVFITETGRVFACGNNVDNKLGLNKRETFIMQKLQIKNKHLQVPFSHKPIPIKELGKHRIIDCSLGSTHSAFLTETGLVYTFGRNSEGQLGSGNCMPREMAAIVKGLKDTPMMVTCSELLTVVATKNNSFHVWGSKLVIQSPLTLLLGLKSSTQMASKTSQDSLNKLEHHERGSSDTLLSQRPSVTEARAPNNKQKSTESLMQSNEAIAKDSPMMSRNSRTSIINNSPVCCYSSADYLNMLYATLNAIDDNDSSITRQTSGPVTLSKSSKKGSGSQGAIETKKDVILKPVSIDLVDRQGTLKSLWEQGLKEIKLEGISCFGCNMLILLHAHISKHNNVNDQQGVVVLGNRLLKRSVVSLTSMGLPTSPWRVKTPFPETEEEDSPAPQGPQNNIDSVLSQSNTSELMETWIKEELKGGIPIQPNNAPAVEVSHGWYPDTLRWSNRISDEGKSKATKKVKSLQKIPTIEEGNEPVENNSPAKINSFDDVRYSNSRPPSTLNRNSSETSYNRVSNPLIKPAKSITDLPTLPTSTRGVTVLNVKRVQSSGSIHSNSSNKGRLLKTPSTGSHQFVRKQLSHDTIKIPNGVPVRKPSDSKSITKKQSTDTSFSKPLISPYAQPLVPIKKPTNKIKKSQSKPPNGLQHATIETDPKTTETNTDIGTTDTVPPEIKVDVEEKDLNERKVLQELAKRQEEELEELRKKVAELESDKVNEPIKSQPTSNNTSDQSSTQTEQETVQNLPRRKSWFKNSDQRKSAGVKTSNQEKSRLCLIL